MGNKTSQTGNTAPDNDSSRNMEEGLTRTTTSGTEPTAMPGDADAESRLGLSLY
jgi:hypothetical protein